MNTNQTHSTDTSKEVKPDKKAEKEAKRQRRKEAKKELRSWNELIKRYSHALVPVVAALILVSCTKEYIQHPTCRRFLELSDKYDDSMNFIRTDTIWSVGTTHQAQYVCDSDLVRMGNYIPDTVGCTTGGYQSFRYIIINR